jgi:hypothetical protein
MANQPTDPVLNSILSWLDYDKAESINELLDTSTIKPTQTNLMALDSLWEEGAGYGYNEGG